MAIVKTGTGQTPASGAANTGLAVGGAAVAGHTNEVLTHNGVKWVGKLPQLKTLTDVNIPTMTPAEDKSLLMYDHNTGVWVPNKTQYADKLAVEKAIDALVSGLSHDVAVIAMQKDPPGTPVVDEYYIVDAAATGDWTGHTNSIAHYVIDHDAGGNEVRKWVFVMPQTGEAHMVEDQKATYAWNGTAWVKVASATSSKLEDLGDVDATKTNAPKKGDILRYDGTKWTPYGAHRTFSLPATGRAGDCAGRGRGDGVAGLDHVREESVVDPEPDGYVGRVTTRMHAPEVDRLNAGRRAGHSSMGWPRSSMPKP